MKVNPAPLFYILVLEDLFWTAKGTHTLAERQANINTEPHSFLQKNASGPEIHFRMEIHYPNIGL